MLYILEIYRKGEFIQSAYVDNIYDLLVTKRDFVKHMRKFDELKIFYANNSLENMKEIKTIKKLTKGR